MVSSGQELDLLTVTDLFVACVSVVKYLWSLLQGIIIYHDYFEAKTDFPH